MEAYKQNKKKLYISAKFTTHTVISEGLFGSFVLYNISLHTTSKTWTIHKRFNDFVYLHSQLYKKIPDLAELPKKKFFMTEQVIIRRKHQLQIFLENLLNRDDLYKHNEVFHFIGLEKECYLLSKGKSIDDDSRASTRVSETILLNEFKRSKSSGVLPKGNFIFPKNKNVNKRENKNHSDLSYSPEYEIDGEESFSIKKPIRKFLVDLNQNIKDKCSLINNFGEKIFKKNVYSFNTLNREEISLLFFGEKIDKKIYYGLLSHCGNVQRNLIGAEKCIEFIAKLIDCEYNPDFDLFVSVLKSSTLFQILDMKLETHISNNKVKIKNACFTILKCLVYADKGQHYDVQRFIKEPSIIENFTKWLED